MQFGAKAHKIERLNPNKIEMLTPPRNFGRGGVRVSACTDRLLAVARGAIALSRLAGAGVAACAGAGIHVGILAVL